MKHMLLSLAAGLIVLLCATDAAGVTATADQPLSAQAGAIASDLAKTPETARLSPQMTQDLLALRETAAAYAAREDDGKLPEDLRCIFRGIAVETQDQLAGKAKADPSERIKAHDRLAVMLRDAEEIGLEAEAIIAERVNAAPGAIDTSDDALTLGTCEASLEPYDPNLIEQP